MRSIEASGLILDGAPGHRVLRHNVIAFKVRIMMNLYILNPFTPNHYEI